ncbi:hypothetical protein MUK42_35275 [Musa troglodytarum]|uniref:Uncharacterized protein n=1 Tax=Musa troglodytarum TaxID=320322 RepID=A0A9E7E7X0_9LILI|nr:hypothetical protein MUK42_35275 [Musa troglodytarum]
MICYKILQLQSDTIIQIKRKRHREQCEVERHRDDLSAVCSWKQLEDASDRIILLKNCNGRAMRSLIHRSCPATSFTASESQGRPAKAWRVGTGRSRLCSGSRISMQAMKAKDSTHRLTIRSSSAIGSNV